jgi:hypothetical protein
VKTAFLHGELEEEIYMDQPEGFIVPGKEDYVCKLKSSLYGLKQSPRQWYKRFDSFMLAHGFKRSDYYSCVYIKLVNRSPIYLLIYVDDMLIAAKSSEEITTLKKLWSSEFDMKDLGAAKKILDREITRDKILVYYFLVSKVTLRRFFSISTCMMRSLLVLLLHLILNCQLHSVLVLMRMLNTCQQFHILVLLVL